MTRFHKSFFWSHLCCMFSRIARHLQWLRTLEHFSCVWFYEVAKQISKKNERKKVREGGKNGKEIQKILHIRFDSEGYDEKYAVFTQQKPVPMLQHASDAVNIIFLLAFEMPNTQNICLIVLLSLQLPYTRFLFLCLCPAFSAQVYITHAKPVIENFSFSYFSYFRSFSRSITRSPACSLLFYDSLSVCLSSGKPKLHLFLLFICFCFLFHFCGYVRSVMHCVHVALTFARGYFRAEDEQKSCKWLEKLLVHV